jgi:two-component system, cell cycle response regulator
MDLRGKVYFADGEFKKGDVVPQALRAKATPILLNGKPAALAVPANKQTLGGLDQAYLGAINEALAYGLAAAGALALVLGLVFGSRISGDLHRLTAAIRAVGDGELRQRVQVASRGEVGVLASAFNRMTSDLARTHDELRRANDQMRAQAEELRELSMRDGLTRLYNRRHFDEQAATLYAQAGRYQQPVTFMIGDIDNFKRINDRFSHAVGDEVLRRVAALVQANVRESDVVARYGGEEFVIAFTNTSVRDGAAACDKLRRVIEAYPWHQVHPDLRVTMSMGVCDDTRLGSFEKMLGVADARLYRAKEAGRNRVCFGDAPGEKTLLTLG